MSTVYRFPTMNRLPSSPRTDSQLSILRSARSEVEKNGILGLRVADVAAGANCSITQIYRYFGDRDGLLATVLGDVYDELIRVSFERYMDNLRSLDTITIDDLVNGLPTPSQLAAMTSQEIRIQILAVSVKNEQLRRRIENVTREMHVEWEKGLDYVDSRLAPGTRIDRRVFTIMILIQMMYYRTLLGDIGFSDEEYRQFLRDKLTL